MNIVITLKRFTIGFFSLVIVIVILFFAWLYISTLQVKETEPVEFINLANAPALQSGQQIKILSWNIQFLAGNENNHFFFDGGEDTWPPIDTRQKILKQIAEVIIADLEVNLGDETHSSPTLCVRYDGNIIPLSTPDARPILMKMENAIKAS